MRIPPTAYGWTDTFPIEVSKGETLTLNVGYLKSSAAGRIRFEVQFNSSGKVLFFSHKEYCFSSELELDLEIYRIVVIFCGSKFSRIAVLNKFIEKYSRMGVYHTHL